MTGDPAPTPDLGSAAEALVRLAAEAWDGALVADPILATAIGDHRFDDRLPDITPEADARERARLQGVLARTGTIPVAALTAADAVTRSALLAFVEGRLDRLEAGDARWAIDPLDGPQVALLNIPAIQGAETPTEGAVLLRRWRAMGPWIDQHRDNVRAAAGEGLISPEAPIRRVVDEIDDLLARPDADWPLLAPATEVHADWSAAEHERFSTALAGAVGGSIRPAFIRYRASLVDEILPRARPDERPGLGHVPGGDAAYRRLTRAHTSLDLEPEAVHLIGLAEVERIDGELETLAGRALGTRGHAEALVRLRTDRGLRFATSGDVLATGRAALARAEAAIGDWFGIVPRAACEVVEMAAHEAKHSTIAYYLSPAADGSRPGRYYLNTSAPETRPRYEAEALAFHESTPGHHLQIAIAQELAGLPEFRRHEGPTAFIEGWGLYVERLADEMGLYSGDLDRIGIASFDGWRACRLVVDTGLHALGWSRERAIAFMTEHTALAPNNIANEVDRYISMPGQAISYKLGQLEISRLRAEAQTALGPRFDIRAFHDAVLGAGAIPLPTLAEIVGRRFAGGTEVSLGDR